MYKGLDLKFEHVIRFKDGTYYQKTTNQGVVIVCTNYRTAYMFTENGANVKIASKGWDDATIEHI